MAILFYSLSTIPFIFGCVFLFTGIYGLFHESIAQQSVIINTSTSFFLLTIVFLVAGGIISIINALNKKNYKQPEKEQNNSNENQANVSCIKCGEPYDTRYGACPKCGKIW